MVKRAISSAAASACTAALIAHALATQNNEWTISLPQSSDGVNVSMPGSSRRGVTRGRVPARRSDPAEPPLAVTEQFQVLLVMPVDGAAMA